MSACACPCDNCGEGYCQECPTCPWGRRWRDGTAPLLPSPEAEMVLFEQALPD